MIVFPAIDLRQGRCVRLRQGRFAEQTIYSDDPILMARTWVEQGATWLHIVNLDGALGEESPNERIMSEIAATSGVPVQFGGGLRDLADIERALSSGATRVVLGTAAVREPALVDEAVRHFGAEVIVVGIDANHGHVATHGWLETSAVTATDLARRVADQGVLRVVYTDIQRDGMLTGVNVRACVELARAADLRVIASGGVGGPDDVRRLVAAEKESESRLEGVIAGQALYTGALSLPEAIRLAGGKEE